MYAKLTFILSCMVLLVTSCVSDLPDSPESPVVKGSEMTFDVAGITRASVTSSLNQFAVYGDVHMVGDEIRPTVVFFDKTEVNNTSEGWKYRGVQYWMPKSEHSFIGISPITVLNAGNNPQYLNSRLTFTYTIPTTAGGTVARHSDVTDILAATHRRFFEDNDTITTTKFKFSHVLSLINLAPALSESLMHDDEYILIHKVEISGFKTKADLKIEPAQRLTNKMTDDQIISIDASGSEGFLTIELANPVKVANNGGNVSIFDNNDAVIMLPQIFTGDSDAKMTVYYTIQDDNTMQLINLPLKNIKWESGKYYIYKFLITLQGITNQETSISNWDIRDAGTIDAN